MDKSEQVARWFESHAAGSLEIRKEEDGDIDQVAIRVSEIEMKDVNGLDDYTSGKRLLLHGEGTIMTDQEPAAIPGEVYEIPLADITDVEELSSGIKLTTGRGHYTIQAN